MRKIEIYTLDWTPLRDFIEGENGVLGIRVISPNEVKIMIEPHTEGTICGFPFIFTEDHNNSK